MGMLFIESVASGFRELVKTIRSTRNEIRRKMGDASALEGNGRSLVTLVNQTRDSLVSRLLISQVDKTKDGEAGDQTGYAVEVEGGCLPVYAFTRNTVSGTSRSVTYYRLKAGFESSALYIPNWNGRVYWHLNDFVETTDGEQPWGLSTTGWTVTGVIPDGLKFSSGVFSGVMTDPVTMRTLTVRHSVGLEFVVMFGGDKVKMVEYFFNQYVKHLVDGAKNFKFVPLVANLPIDVISLTIGEDKSNEFTVTSILGEPTMPLQVNEDTYYKQTTTMKEYYLNGNMFDVVHPKLGTGVSALELMIEHRCVLKLNGHVFDPVRMMGG